MQQQAGLGAVIGKHDRVDPVHRQPQMQEQPGGQQAAENHAAEGGKEGEAGVPRAAQGPCESELTGHQGLRSGQQVDEDNSQFNNPGVVDHETRQIPGIDDLQGCHAAHCQQCQPQGAPPRGYRKVGPSRTELLAHQGGRGDAKAKAHYDRKRHQADAYPIGRIGVGAVAGDDTEECQECQLYHALLEYRRCADDRELPGDRPVDSRRLAGLDVEIATPPQRRKAAGGDQTCRAAAQGHTGNPQGGEGAVSECQQVGKTDIQQGAEKQEPKGRYDITCGAQCGGQHHGRRRPDAEHAQPENKAGGGPRGCLVQPEQAGNGFWNEQGGQAEQAREAQGQAQGCPGNMLGLPDLAGSPTAGDQGRRRHRNAHQQGLYQKEHAMAGSDRRYLRCADVGDNFDMRETYRGKQQVGSDGGPGEAPDAAARPRGLVRLHPGLATGWRAGLPGNWRAGLSATCVPPGHARAFSMAKTVRGVVVDHAGRLHVGIHDGRAYESEAAFFHILAESVGYRGSGGHGFDRRPVILHRLIFNEAPYVVREAAEFFLNAQKRPGILPGTVNFQPIADDPGILQQCVQLAVGVAGDLFGVKVVEQGPVALPLAQDRDPGQPGLGAFEQEHFEQVLVIAGGNPPLSVVIAGIQWIIATPGTAFFHRRDSMQRNSICKPCRHVQQSFAALAAFAAL